MSHFPDGVVYIIVPTLSETEEMLNNMKRSFNVTSDTLRRSDPLDLPQQTLYKVKEPVSAAFNGYTWYNWEEIQVELEASKWQ